MEHQEKREERENIWSIKKPSTTTRQRPIGITETSCYYFSTELLKEARARAAMARPVSEDESVKVIKDKSVAIVDWRASSTLT